MFKKKKASTPPAGAPAAKAPKVVIMHPKEFGELGSALGTVEQMIANAQVFDQSNNDEAGSKQLQYNEVTVVEARA